MSKIFGIDISAWQQGYPYDRANAEGVKFAILRAGFSQTKDKQFETHYANAKRLGWGVGAYWYMYAKSVDAARAEARAFINVLRGKQFDYPVYLDIEDKTLRSLGRGTLDAMIKAFCETMESAGYYCGVYTNRDWYNNVISGSTLNKSYDWWIAQWSTSEPSHGINYGMWQFGGETNYIRGNKVAGVTTDQNYALKDYPSIIKSAGLNGYPKQSSGNAIQDSISRPTTKSNEDLANEVIAGQWGNGPERRTRLAAAGYDYSAVQAIVNSKLNTKKSNEEIANEILEGKWGNGDERKSKLTQAGYDYNAIQAIVNEKLNNNTRTYIVKSGDTLGKIARKFETTYQKIAADNGIANPNKIYPGQKLIIK